MKGRSIKYLFVKSELGAGTYGASLGIEAVMLAAEQKDYRFFSAHPNHWIEDESPDLDRPPYAHNIDALVPLYYAIAHEVSRSVKEGHLPVILSGDHSNAGGTIAGLRMADPKQRLGVIWIDAHGDLHSPYTTPSGNMHGMPLGASLHLRNNGPVADIVAKEQMNPIDPQVEELWEQLCRIGGIWPKIGFADLAYIGIRDLEDVEWELVRRNNILHFTPDQLLGADMNQIAQQALHYLRGCDSIYVSFDVDAMDTHLVEGTGTPVPEGLLVPQAHELLKALWHSPKLCALEFTEVNPLLDTRNRTAALVADLLQGLLAQPAPGA